MPNKYLIAAVLLATICISVAIVYVWQSAPGYVAPEYTASSTSSTDSPMAWDTVTFTDNSTGEPISWDWDFGDGTTSTEENVTHVYENSGTYTATLTVTYGDGTTKTSSRHITVTVLGVYPDSVMQILATRRIEYSLWYTPGLDGIDEPLIETVMTKHKIFKTLARISLYHGPYEIVAVNRYDGRTFILFGDLEDQFNKMMEAEEITVDENVALTLSKAHVKLLHHESSNWFFDEPLYLQSSSDIPWSEESNGTDPSVDENRVKPPQVTQVGENYQVEFYTWNETMGLIRKWTYEVGRDGQLVYQEEEITSSVGDYDVPVTTLGMGPNPTLATKRVANTSMVVIGTANPNVTIKVSISTDNGISWADQTEAQTTADNDGNWRTTVALTEGDKTGIRVRAVNLENVDGRSVIFGYVQADIHSPVLTITSPAVGTVTDNENIVVTGIVIRDVWEDWGDLTLTILVGTENVVVPISPDGTFTHTISLKEGMNTIAVSVTDGVNTPVTSFFTVTLATTSWWIIVFGIGVVVLLGVIYLIARKRNV